MVGDYDLQLISGWHTIYKMRRWHRIIVGHDPQTLM